MKDFSELVKTRHSTRKFTGEELDGHEVELLLKAALMAPSSRGLQSWEFIVVDDKEKLAALSKSKEKGCDFIAGAPLAIVVLGRPNVSDVWIEDASVASTMILLQAEDLGLGACWVQIRNRAMADGKPACEIVRSLLCIPDNIEVLSILAIGHKGTERKPFDEDKLSWENVHINSYSSEE